MKKSNVIVGIIYILASVFFFYLAEVYIVSFKALFYALGGAVLGIGALNILNYIYWNSPKKKEKYQELEREQEIYLENNKNVDLKDRAGRIAYLIGMLIISLSLFLVAMLDMFNLAINARFLIIFLGIYLFFQYFLGVFLYNFLKRRRERRSEF